MADEKTTLSGGLAVVLGGGWCDVGRVESYEKRVEVSVRGSTAGGHLQMSVKLDLGELDGVIERLIHARAWLAGG